MDYTYQKECLALVEIILGEEQYVISVNETFQKIALDPDTKVALHTSMRDSRRLPFRVDLVTVPHYLKALANNGVGVKKTVQTLAGVQFDLEFTHGH